VLPKAPHLTTILCEITTEPFDLYATGQNPEFWNFLETDHQIGVYDQIPADAFEERFKTNWNHPSEIVYSLRSKLLWANRLSSAMNKC
jgi:hypothetical protein